MKIVKINAQLLGERHFPEATATIPALEAEDFGYLLERAQDLDPSLTAEMVFRAIYRYGTVEVHRGIVKRRTLRPDRFPPSLLKELRKVIMEGLQQALVETRLELVSAYRSQKISAPGSVIPALAVMFGETAVLTMQIPDLRMRISILRNAARKFQVEGYAFIYDGYLDRPTGPRQDAFIVITATRDGWAEAQAWPYTPDPVSGVILAEEPMQDDRFAEGYKLVFFDPSVN